MSREAGTGSRIWDCEPSAAVDAVEAILGYAARVGASDAHIDPRSGDVLIRMRIDGELEPVATLRRSLHEEVVARLKILSGARTDLHSVPQDGRFQAVLADRLFNVRLSFMPTYQGENAVVRLLPARAGGRDTFGSLGFAPDHASMLDRALGARSGLILVTGPTGSGKTTTLRVCLSRKAEEPILVMTLEDPVEYEVDGVRHVHIRESYGVSFASGLRSALRQDPDVIMVGEIRDNETARTAVNTALTGHLVLSTMHTTSAIGSITRLAQMGVDSFLSAATLRLVVSQRLIRMACHACSGEAGLCDECRGTGYLGRSVIAEALEIDDEMRRLISRGADEASIYDAARARGFRSIDEDGDEKVRWGVTSREEVARTLMS